MTMKKYTGTKEAERQYIYDLISGIVERCPRRAPTSEDERQAQLIMQEEFRKIGLDTDLRPFKYNRSLYANIALHFGLGSLGTAVSGLAPHLGLALHGLAAGSYWRESMRKGYLLRRVFPFRDSQNLLATMPAATGEPTLRVVFVSHADAAFTGLIFSDFAVEKLGGNPPPALSFLKRSMELATKSQAALAGFDALRTVFGPLTWPLRPIEYALNLPGFLAFILNMEVVLRNQVVPGAADNLSGSAVMPVLAKRLGPDKPADVEYVFVVTGCEEASLGGSDALAREMEGVWDKDKTVIIGLDGLTNGQLQYIHTEGEVTPLPMPAWLRNTVEEAKQGEERFAAVKGYAIPVGGTDVAAFLARGFAGVCLTAVDERRGAPRHYHQMSDTPANMDMDELMYSLDFAEHLARTLIKQRR